MTVKRLVLFFALILSIGVSYVATRTRSKDTTDTKVTAAPMVHVPTLSFYGKSDSGVTFDNFKGKVVLVNLWATWCPPCVAELPSLDRLQTMLPPDKFQVVAISLDTTSMKTVIDFLRKHHIQHLIPYWDKDRQVPLKWVYGGLPTSFLVNADGYVIKQYDGPFEWDNQHMVSEIEGQLK